MPLRVGSSEGLGGTFGLGKSAFDARKQQLRLGPHDTADQALRHCAQGELLFLRELRTREINLLARQEAIPGVPLYRVGLRDYFSDQDVAAEEVPDYVGRLPALPSGGIGCGPYVRDLRSLFVPRHFKRGSQLRKGRADVHGDREGSERWGV